MGKLRYSNGLQQENPSTGDIIVNGRPQASSYKQNEGILKIPKSESIYVRFIWQLTYLCKVPDDKERYNREGIM